MMYGLFLLVCYTFQPCHYEPQGYVYPDDKNCIADIQQQGLPPEYECLPVDGVLYARKQ
ncbi:Uncharacterised protein [Yersinia frederiksenii]|nr:Uncharacterised protein [Yersinia frederiksenii]